MKKTLIIALFAVFSTTFAFSQTTVRANTAGWLTGVFNIGAETAISDNITFMAEGYFSPLWNKPKFKAKGFMLTPELRYYFGQAFDGHHLGLHGNYVQYSEFQPSGVRNIRDGYAYAVGLAYGYTWTINKHWSFDLFAGAGWWHMKNDVFCREDPEFILEDNKVENKFNLTRFGATFAYKF